ncbi:MAG TPA: LacI family DNA-binding transcriptional regulator, partial [Phototrophicaceae bacterium]|nr:LacI family DNA-binding transcriptional regulator [Phototrophicaceae bacterium]
PAVAADLRSRVLNAVQVLGYQPKRAARRLRAQSSNVIGLIISDIQNPYFISVIRGVEDAAYANQMNIVLCNSDEDPAKERIYLGVLEAERVAGLIIVPTHDTNETDLNRLQQMGIPVILLDRLVAAVQVDAVRVDNERGAYEAVKHLLDLGCRKIAHISGSPNLTTGHDRAQGYQHALAEVGLKPEAKWIKTGDFKTESGYRLTLELLDLPKPPDALFVANNLMTLGALRALRERNVRVPEDMALVGFDDMPWSAEFHSPLTAVSQPTYELGQESVHLLLRRLAQPDAPVRTVVLHTRLIVRESCGAALKLRR